MTNQQSDPIHALLAALTLSVGEARAWELFVDAIGAVLDEILPEEIAAECRTVTDILKRPKAIGRA